VSTHIPHPDAGPGGRRPGARRSRMPRADSTAAGFIGTMFSAAWWREQRALVAGLFRRRPAGPRPGPLPSLPELLDLDVPEDTFVLQTPAKGDAYNFLVSIRCSWSVQGTAFAENRKRRTQEIRRLVARQRPVVREQIEATIREAARRHAPYRAAAAEKDIGKALSECKADGDLHVRIRARVDVCEPVREDLKTMWQHRLAEDARGDSKKATVELIGELQEAWRGLLLEGLKGIGEVQTAKAAWIAPYALALAQDPEQSAGVYLRDMIEHRVRHAEDLLTDLSDLVVNQNIDAIEFAFGSDSALRALLSLLGVPIPPRGSANGEGKTTGANGDSKTTGDSHA
jgi:hypothetical protein